MFFLKFNSKYQKSELEKVYGKTVSGSGLNNLVKVCTSIVNLNI